MAFKNYFPIASIKKMDANQISENFINYYNSLSEELKQEIADIRPDLANAIHQKAEKSIDFEDEKENIQLKQKENIDEILPSESEENQDASAIIDEWESISILSWRNERVYANVLVCKIMPDHNRVCRIHRIPLIKKEIRLDHGQFGLYGYLCPECMDLYLEESQLEWIIEVLDRRNIPAWMQPLEMTLKEWNEMGAPVSIQNDTVIYIPDVWVDGKNICPIHQKALVEDSYQKVYKDRQITFEAYYCADCGKIIMRNSKAQQLELACGEIGIPPIIFKRLKAEEKKKVKVKQLPKKPELFVCNGVAIPYEFDESVEWQELTEEDVVIVSYSCACIEEDHDSEDVLALVKVQEKKGEIKRYLVKFGYCDICDRYYLAQEDYSVIYKKGRPEITIYDETNSDYFISSGKVFDLERDHLNTLENDLTDKIRRIKESPDYMNQFAVGAYDDGNLSYAKAKSKPLKKEIDRISEFIPKPYGYRTDIVFGDQTKTFYLGVSDIELDGAKKVISFNSDLGRKLVNYRTLDLFLEDMKYHVKRRRQFDIEDAKLFGYIEQSDEDAIFRSGITDRFLINVLNMRKKQHQLIDIIATIQENQNTIVDLPINQNLIVQGCAGSGKTMIMLHRLSALKYNNPEFDFENAVILTPNENFNTHINGLASSLQLGYIERFSVEAYYSFLLSQYDVSFKLQNKISDEMNVNQTYVDFMYSDEFKIILNKSYEKVIAELHSYYEEWNRIADSLGIPKVYTKDVPDSQLMLPLQKEAYALADKIQEQERKYLEQKKKVADLEQKSHFLQEKISETKKRCEEVVVEEFSKIFIKLRESIEEKTNEKNILESQIKEWQEEYQKIEKTLFVVRKGAKLGRISKKIEAAQKRQEQLSAEIQKLQGFMYIDVLALSEKERKEFLDSLGLFLEIVSDSVRIMNRQKKIYEEYRMEFLKLKETQKTEQQKLVHYMQEKYPENISIELQGFQQKLKNITAKSVYMNVYEYASKIADDRLHERTGKWYTTGIRGTHRYDLYLQLIFAMRYFNYCIGNHIMICVDEGQDLAPNEYLVISEINGGKSIFNIYGDVNQLLKYNRGISDWKVLDTVIPKIKMYFLNENYRNTNQITQFCNDTFSMNVALTGVDGKKVKEIHRERLEQSLSDLKISEERIAVILPRAVKKEIYIDQDRISKFIRSYIGEKIDNGKISLVYVDEVKGVEFDKVFVVPNGMSKNEKYIAYTRALSELIIVLDETLDVSEKIEDEKYEGIEEKENLKEHKKIEIMNKNIKFGKVIKKRRLS